MFLANVSKGCLQRMSWYNVSIGCHWWMSLEEVSEDVLGGYSERCLLGGCLHRMSQQNILRGDLKRMPLVEALRGCHRKMSQISIHSDLLFYEFFPVTPWIIYSHYLISNKQCRFLFDQDSKRCLRRFSLGDVSKRCLGRIPLENSSEECLERMSLEEVSQDDVPRLRKMSQIVFVLVQNFVISILL